MLKIQEIRELIKLIDQSSIDEFTYEHEGSKIKLKKRLDELEQAANRVTSVAAVEQSQSPAPQAVAAMQEVKEQPKKEAPVQEESLHKITSPMVGTFYAASSPDTDDYVKVGSKVTSDSVVCIVEAMKLFNEIEAEVKGEIVEILAENGQLVEYGQPLFLVRPE
ncbi:acetyl-CoA carboxylase biotin carboxyl carrier protein [Metabacillus idriensis]|uniref:acetyl-CoA carboxylase biotin carboxyl carrier protein n=1 Tax=Bacillaceae TaxID=186817 RepID=UPI00105A7E86|nr:MULTISPECIES: acetyl-CoA carboxylase biotin carboxyl carrier protein [Bacillaceae]MDR0138422.1 acetyl-CoA carboxylase biotin carboxyl carrier protein [Metabacillus idriensis]TDL82350.1 acetyl-CoA carboxylase biotin carboxyl carrier protein [Peribacillus frigoritolerans]